LCAFIRGYWSTGRGPGTTYGLFVEIINTNHPNKQDYILSEGNFKCRG